ncbi:MAG: hypothetical protein NWP87_03070 [Winogradskyella sp.]|nr:hypothetical protein [Winogradskyella sp.]
MSKIAVLVYDWEMGVIMIGIFVVVCILLIGILINFMSSGKKKKDAEDL